MKTKIATVAFAIAAVTSFGKVSTPVGFTDDMDAALARAKEEGKPIVVDFSGSDWCGWCKRLDSEVFSKAEFLDSVTNRYVLVFIDTPKDSSLLTEAARVQNPVLREKYNVHGFPTIIVLDSTGAEIFRTGYRQGGAAAYVKHLDAVVAAGPYMKEWVEPLQKRLDAILTDSGRAMEQIPRKAINRRIKVAKKVLEDLNGMLAEEQAKEVPEAVKPMREEVLSDLEGSIKQIETFLKRLKQQRKAIKRKNGDTKKPEPDKAGDE